MGPTCCSKFNIALKKIVFYCAVLQEITVLYFFVVLLFLVFFLHFVSHAGTFRIKYIKQFLATEKNNCQKDKKKKSKVYVYVWSITVKSLSVGQKKSVLQHYTLYVINYYFPLFSFLDFPPLTPSVCITWYLQSSSSLNHKQCPDSPQFFALQESWVVFFPHTLLRYPADTLGIKYAKN